MNDCANSSVGHSNFAEIRKDCGHNNLNNISNPSKSVIEIIQGDDKCHFLSECDDHNCIYARSRSKLRYLYEQIIVSFCVARKRVNIMFYASHKLLQEFIILKKIAHCVNEIHLIDFSYENINEYKNEFAFFQNQIKKINPSINIYFHHSLSLLESNKSFFRRIDLIGGIDIDYVHKKIDHMYHRHMIKKLAGYALNIGGKLVISQHFNDMIDMAEYQQNSHYALVPVMINDFVKPAFYHDYISKHNHDTLCSHNIYPISHILV